MSCSFKESSIFSPIAILITFQAAKDQRINEGVLIYSQTPQSTAVITLECWTSIKLWPCLTFPNNYNKYFIIGHVFDSLLRFFTVHERLDGVLHKHIILVSNRKYKPLERFLISIV